MLKRRRGRSSENGLVLDPDGLGSLLRGRNSDGELRRVVSNSANPVVMRRGRDELARWRARVVVSAPDEGKVFASEKVLRSVEEIKDEEEESRVDEERESVQKGRPGWERADGAEQRLCGRRAKKNCQSSLVIRSHP